jgi:hypothetical protein
MPSFSSPVHPALSSLRLLHSPGLCQPCTPSSPKRLDSVQSWSSPSRFALSRPPLDVLRQALREAGQRGAFAATACS